MGISNQVFYEIYVSSEKRFDEFEFNGITYKYVSSKLSSGVIEPRNTHGIRVTTLERTVVDSIKDFEKVGGLEELLNCIESIPYLSENELIKYLDAYNQQFLYQKTGFLMEHYKDQFQLSDEFISYCRNKIGKSTRVFWNSGMTSFLNTTFLIDITYGQYIIVYIATLYTLCLGTAVASFLLSRFSRNLITLMLKLIPVFAVITVLCTKVFELTFSPANLLYIVTGITGIEAYICVFVFIAGLAISRYFLRREKTVDVL